MPGQIPGALGVLSKFLSEENARLDQEIKDRDARQTIDYAATEFSKIGPDATPQDVRNVYYKALTFASDNKSQETIPMLSGLFSESAQFVRQTKLDRQDQRLTEAIGTKTGLDLAGLSGQGALGIANFDAQTTKWFNTRTEEGRSYAQAYKLKGGKFTPTEERVDIDLSTFDIRADAQHRGQRYTGGGQGKLQKTLKETPDGRIIMVYPQLGERGGMYVQDQTGRFEKYTGPTIDRQSTLSQIRARSFREAEQNFDIAQGELQLSGKSFANILLKYGSDDVPKTSLFKNINSDDYRKETYQTLLSYQQAGRLDDLIYGNEEENIDPASAENQAILIAAYERFIGQMNKYGGALSDIDKFSGNIPGGEQLEGAPKILPPGTEDLMSPHTEKQVQALEQITGYAENIFTGTTEYDKKAQAKWQEWIATNLRVTGVTSLDQLDEQQTQLFLDWLAIHTKIQ